MDQLVKFDQMKAEITQFVKPCMEIKVTDDESCENALAAGKEVKSFAKRIEERRKELVGPLNAEVKRINDYCKIVVEPLDQVEAHLKTQLKNREIALRAEREKEMKRLEAEKQKAEAEAQAKLQKEREEAATLSMFMAPSEVKQAEIVAQITNERTVIDINENHKKAQEEVKANKVHGARLVWKFEVTNIEQVPRAFMILDERLVREAIKTGIRDIPGIAVFQEPQIAL